MNRFGRAAVAAAMIAGACGTARADFLSTLKDVAGQAWNAGRRLARDNEAPEKARARIEKAESIIATARRLGYDLVPVALQAMEIHELCRVQRRVGLDGEPHEMNSAQWFMDHQSQDDEAATDAYACCYPAAEIGLARIATPFLDSMPAISGREFPKFVDRATVVGHAEDLATEIVKEAKGKAVERAEAVKGDVSKDVIAQSKGAWDVILKKCQQALTSNGYPSSLTR